MYTSLIGKKNTFFVFAFWDFFQVCFFSITYFKMINNTRQYKKSQKTQKNVENMPKNCF